MRWAEKRDTTKKKKKRRGKKKTGEFLLLLKTPPLSFEGTGVEAQRTMLRKRKLNLSNL